ncbi:hypothetical protein ACTHEV_005160 [Klebsiella pneumoniae]|uniref:hypothetical protein n=1 Tax=Klebsiella pneumoniae TaxID=573 RepID=UPI001091039B|nr:hypothetical protein [Klebsiella pneumoniae]VGB99537.1 Uncharacterised protein [Klebsiella pneumoniae]
MTLHQQATTAQKAFATILWLVTAIPLALVAVFFFATAHGVEMWCGGGVSAAFAFGSTQMWWRAINNKRQF